ncbi:DMT family transporter [Marinobacter sp. JSM 1782161]|uniref:DMT family transporter n=1 Tax=Marinobacter sp. JSM 1782161 TaxID=2685906 RepID=UPI001A9FECF9|nr:DMT family transporter [Marinobacter sp. JSM 1782161]
MTAIQRGAAFVLAGEMLLAVMGAIIKHLSPDIPSAQLVFLRNILGLAIIGPLLISREGVAGLKTRHLRFHLMRAVIGVSAMYCYYLSLEKLVLTEAVLLKLTAPFFIPVIALLWLKESTSRLIWLTIAVGFAGVLVILDPASADLNDYLFVAAGLAGALLGATAKVTIRRMGVTEPSARIVFYFGLFGTLVTAPAAAAVWVPPGLSTWLWMGGLALCATLAQMLITTTYRIAPAGQIGQFTYSSVIFAALLGWLFFMEPVTGSQVIGCALIVGAGLFNLRQRRAPA